MIRVFKFGGALLNDAKGIERMVSIVEEFKCEPLIVVVSAIGKTTNALENLLSLAIHKDEKLAAEYFSLKSFHINLIQSLPFVNHNKLINEVENLFRNLWDVLNQPFDNYFTGYDEIVSFGEKISGKIMAARLSAKKLIVAELPAEKIIATNSNHTDASVNWQQTEKNITAHLFPLLHDGKIVITQGFIGSDNDGNITTLGREGSDYTAAIIGSILNANEIVIWKDVPGLMNADPKLFKDAVKLNNISYHEAIELTFYGASVIHPKTIQPLQKKGLTLQVRSFWEPHAAPSLISENRSEDDKIPKIIAKPNQTLLSFSSRNMDFIEEANLFHIFKALSRHKIHINLMQNSAVSFSVCFDQNQKKQKALINELSNMFFIKYNSGLTLLTFRYYNNEILKQFTDKKKVLLVQKNRTTAQFLGFFGLFT